MSNGKDNVKQLLSCLSEYMCEVSRLGRKMQFLEKAASSETDELLRSKLNSIRHEYSRRLTEAEQRQLEAEKLIDSLPRPDYRMILRLRYCQNMDWPHVREGLGRAGYPVCERQIYRMHGSAIKMLSDEGGVL